MGNRVIILQFPKGTSYIKHHKCKSILLIVHPILIASPTIHNYLFIRPIIGEIWRYATLLTRHKCPPLPIRAPILFINTIESLFNCDRKISKEQVKRQGSLKKDEDALIKKYITMSGSYHASHILSNWKDVGLIRLTDETNHSSPKIGIAKRWRHDSVKSVPVDFTNTNQFWHQFMAQRNGSTEKMRPNE